MAFTVICMGKNINLRDVELKLRFDNLHITIEQVDYGVFHDSIMRHSHSKNYYEAHLICGGKGTLIADEEEYPLEKGSLFMTGPDVVHAQITDSQDLKLKNQKTPVTAKHPRHFLILNFGLAKIPEMVRLFLKCCLPNRKPVASVIRII